ncbi:MAG: carboxymuconolactone decarboxylase family protein [Gammaproteobacteria bacterium]|nr:carboxymuconolactone decarboxylase family protein [Gammaproteobacteria bacterium]
MSREKLTRLGAVSRSAADVEATEVLDKAEAQVGFVPNMYANMANLPGLLDTYLHGYDLFRDKGGFTPPEQETVFLAISHENHCEYCMSAHSMLAAKKSGLDEATLGALRNGELIADPKLAALDHFTRVMLRTRGNPEREDIDAFVDAGYEEWHVLSVILAIAVKTLSNYSNHLFNTEVDDVFAEYEWPE